MCSLLGSCQCQFVFEADGGVYPCDFYVTDEWKLGTIREHDLLELYRTDTCKRFIESSHAAVPQCQDCRWKFLCRGGCRRDRDMTPGGSLERNYYCEAYADFLQYAYPKLLDLARYVQRVRAQRARAGGLS